MKILIMAFLTLTALNAFSAENSCEGTFTKASSQVNSAQYQALIDSKDFDIFFRSQFNSNSIYSDRNDSGRELVTILEKIKPGTIAFDAFGKSISRVFVQVSRYTPLSSLMTESTRSPRYDLIAKLFKTGYEISAVKGLYSDNGDMNTLIFSSESTALKEAAKSSEANRKQIRDYFAGKFAISPLFSRVPAETYALIVIRKLNILFQAGADLSSVLGGMNAIYWHDADSKSRAQIVRNLISTLGVKSAANHSDKDGLTPLMYAVGMKDEIVMRELIKYGADIHAKVPESARPGAVEDNHLIIGETVQDTAIRLGLRI